MRREHQFIAQATLLFLLLLALIAQIGRMVFDVRWAKIDLTGRDPGTLSESARTYLSHLQARLSITYFATPEKAMPSGLKRVGSSVHDLLAAMKAQAPDKIDYRIIDPDLSGKIGQAYAARKKVSPFSVRDIRKDEHSERKVWSSLVLAYGEYPEILIQKITPDDLPLLEQFIIAALKAREHPPKPVIGVAAPPYFTLFRAFAKHFGDVRDIDLTGTSTIPKDVDVLFWFDPQNVTQDHIKALQQFLDSGRTAVLAGSPYLIDYAYTTQPQYRAYATGPSWTTLLTPFGIRPQPDLLMDQSNGPIFFRDETGTVREINAPFHLRVMPGYYSLKGFLSPARGALNFVAAGPLEINPRKVSEAGFQADILGTTTENAWVQSIPQGVFTNGDLQNSLKVGKQNLMVHLTPDTPWKGDLIVLASASPFRDGIINQPNYGHRVFLQTVMRTLTEGTRIVRGRIAHPAPPPLPERGTLARIFWRFAAVFLIPALLLYLGARRYGAAGGTWSVVGVGGFPLRVGFALVGLLIASRIWTADLGRLADLTEGHQNTPLPFTRQHLAGKNLEADLILPPRADLPARLKNIERTTIETLRDLRIPVTVRRPSHLSDQDRRHLASLGLKPFEVRTVRHDAEISEQVLSGLILHHPGGATAIPRLDDHTINHLAFLLVAAEERLTTGQFPQIALISEPPRLSPAEAYEYEQNGLSPPQGADVFSQLQTLLRDYGYRVTYVTPHVPALPDNKNLVIWMQPRRQAAPMIHEVSRFLAQGGHALVALQHYNIQQRQYRGEGFQTVYWPQPQYQDFNQYLTPLGLEQVKEVLMDRTAARLRLETQINRTAVREYEDQEVALPFLIRAVAADFNPASPITRHLGDQLFIWGNRFAVQPDSLSAQGLQATALITTSDRAWAYDWTGGWLPEKIFSPASFLSGKQPLALWVEGTFPVFDEPDAQNGPKLYHPRPNPPGELALIGSSEMFKNDHLYAPGFQHDQLMLNTVAMLAHGPQFAELQARSHAPRGFPYVPPDQKAIWRVLVVGAGPLSILLYGLLRYVVQRRRKGFVP